MPNFCMALRLFFSDLLCLLREDVPSSAMRDDCQPLEITFTRCGAAKQGIGYQGCLDTHKLVKVPAACGRLPTCIVVSPLFNAAEV